MEMVSKVLQVNPARDEVDFRDSNTVTENRKEMGL